MENNYSKVAYPNIAGKSDRGPIYDVNKWIGVLKEIYAKIHSKELDRQSAIDGLTANWDTDEKYDFINWMKYYEDETTEKYNVKTANFIKQAFDVPIPEAWVNREDRAEDGMNISTRKDKGETKREKELQKAKQFKSKMKSRLRSFKSLLDKYNDILPKHDLDKIYDELYSLEKSVSKLDVYASLQDCVIRTANRMKKFGFSEGAEFLQKCAVDQGTLQPIPDTPIQTTQPSNLNDIINRLEVVSKELKSRNMIRELASIDILLNELEMASFFPEISDAQSKLIDGFGYASNKIGDILAKLRGAEKTKGADQPPMPTPVAQPITQKPVAPKQQIDTTGLMEKPVPEVKKKLPTG